MRCTAQSIFLVFWLLLKRNIIFFCCKEYLCRFSTAHELQSTTLDPDYGLFIDYQMHADKHESLDPCLCLLRKNLNNLAELGICSAYCMTHRSNTEYCKSTSRQDVSIPMPCLYPDCSK